MKWQVLQASGRDVYNFWAGKQQKGKTSVPDLVFHESYSWITRPNGRT